MIYYLIIFINKMSLEYLDNKDKQSLNSDIESFDKKSLANSVSIDNEENEEIKKTSFLYNFPIEKEQKKIENAKERSSNSNSSKSDNKQENNILNLDSSDDLITEKNPLKDIINNDNSNKKKNYYFLLHHN